MTARMTATALAIAGLAGCTAVEAPGRDSAGLSAGVPDAVLAVAAPHQDLGTARLREADGCYWYRHVGPVETTPLPLRTIEGRPICARPQGRGASADGSTRAALSSGR